MLHTVLCFTLQGPVMCVEALLKREAAKRKLLLRPFEACLLTLAVLFTMAYYLFFPPCDIDTNLAARVRRL